MREIIRRRKAMNNQEMMELSTVDKSDFEELVKECTASGIIDQNLYTEYDVKRGLRDSNGNGVLTGLTEISDVLGNQSVHGRKIPVDGELYFQGYNVEELIKRSSLDRFRFEEATYLLLFGVLPDKDQLDRFIRILTDLQELSGAFIRDVIMKATSTNLMNSLMKSILSLYSYDEKPDDISIPNVLRQSLQLIAKMPLLSVYAYQSYRHFKLDGTLMIKNPKKGYSTAENILYMLRDDGDFTELEAKVLDICLVLHAEHGGGNNSTFTTHVVTSSGTDTYSAIASSIASLKGPKHGGANLKVQEMFTDIKAHCSDWDNKDEICTYLNKILDKEAFDHAGLIYGMGHAVYTNSDPTAFTSVFTNQTPTITLSGLSADATTLAVSQMPSHSHTYTLLAGSANISSGMSSTGRVQHQGTTGATGGGDSHSHSVSGSASSSTVALNVQYVDLIIASKN
jgi:citrate synthase